MSSSCGLNLDTSNTSIENPTTKTACTPDTLDD